MRRIGATVLDTDVGAVDRHFCRQKNGKLENHSNTSPSLSIRLLANYRCSPGTGIQAPKATEAEGEALIQRFCRKFDPNLVPPCSESCS